LRSPPFGIGIAAQSQPAIGENGMARKSKAKTAKKKSAGRKAAKKTVKKVAKKAAKKVAKKVARPKSRKPTAAKRSTAKAASTGLQTVTPYLIVSSGARAIDFYKRAFGATEVFRMSAPDGQRVMHATLSIYGSNVMLSDEFPEFGGNRGPDIVGSTTVSIYLQVPNADKAFAQAIEAGATAITPVADMFWGDRFGKLRDPFGHEWSVAHHVRDVSPAEMAEGAKKAFAAA
jgi:PhnB protein